MYTFWLAVVKNQLDQFVKDLYNQYGPDIQYNVARFDSTDFRTLPPQQMKDLLEKTLDPQSKIRTSVDMKNFISDLDNRTKLLEEFKVCFFFILLILTDCF